MMSPGGGQPLSIPRSEALQGFPINNSRLHLTLYWQLPPARLLQPGGRQAGAPPNPPPAGDQL